MINNFSIGEHIEFTVDENYYYSDTDYECKIVFTNSATNLTYSSTRENGIFDFSITSAQTSNFTAGTYKYIIYFIDTDDNIKNYFESYVKVSANPYSSAVDTRTHARRTLDAIEAVIENRATTDQQNYAIGGRSLTRMSIDELFKFRDRYKIEVALEEKKTTCKTIRYIL